jgi:iron-sulfur cluster repair protein YtfE (RIC family)
MKRDPALRSLSHDHHQALFVAQKLRRADATNAAAARALFVEFWNREGRRHFQVEEEVLFPSYAVHGDAHDPLVLRALGDHVEIRAVADSVSEDLTELHELGRRLAEHVRLEERELFPLIEASMPTDALATLTADLERAERSSAEGSR